MIMLSMSTWTIMQENFLLTTFHTIRELAKLLCLWQKLNDLVLYVWLCHHHYSSTSYEERVNTVLSWLDKPNATRYIPNPHSTFQHQNETWTTISSPIIPFLPRPQFMAAYFDEPDHSGHQGGPFSDLVNTARLYDLWYFYSPLAPRLGYEAMSYRCSLVP